MSVSDSLRPVPRTHLHEQVVERQRRLPDVLDAREAMESKLAGIDSALEAMRAHLVTVSRMRLLSWTPEDE